MCTTFLRDDVIVMLNENMDEFPLFVEYRATQSKQLLSDSYDPSVYSTFLKWCHKSRVTRATLCSEFIMCNTYTTKLPSYKNSPCSIDLLFYVFFVANLTAILEYP